MEPLSVLGLPPELLQDVICCLLLSETVYKAAEGPPAVAVAALNDLRLQFPPGLAPVISVQFCRRSTEHRYMLARSSTALYVAFMGTKQPRDYLADANLLTRLLWTEAEVQGLAGSSSSNAAPSADTPAGARTGPTATTEAATSSRSRESAEEQVASSVAAPAPAVHRGFLSRAQAVQLEPLLAHAQQQGLRFVLCGHSLGGAVAQLCTLRLLRLLHAAPPSPESLCCIVFGCPAIGNAALASYVLQQGWQSHFHGIALPEDVVPRLLLQPVAATQERLNEMVPAASLEDAAANQLEAAAAEQQVKEQQQKQQPQQAESTLAHQPLDSGGSSSTGNEGSYTAAGRQGASGADAAGRGAAQAARTAALAAGRPLWAAVGMAAGAARTAQAGAGRLMPPPLLPAFTHVGKQYHLLSHGLVPAGARNVLAAPARAPTSVETDRGNQRQQAQQARQIQLLPLGLHSMQFYRGRAAVACWAAAGGKCEGKGEGDEAPVVLTNNLAPTVVVEQAVACLPVLPPPTAPAPHIQRQQIVTAAGQAARTSSWRPRQLQQRFQPQQPAVRVTVAVHGAGLEGCTGALLKMPGAGWPQLLATQVNNLARQRLLLDLAQVQAAGGSSSSTGSSVVPGKLRAAGSALRKAAGKWGFAQRVSAAYHGGQPGMLLQFSVPAAAVAQLQLQHQEHGTLPGHGQEHDQDQELGQLLLPQGSLLLLTDFSKQAAPVQLRPQVVWLLGLEPSVTTAVFHQVRAAAAAGSRQQQARQQIGPQWGTSRLWRGKLVGSQNSQHSSNVSAEASTADPNTAPPLYPQQPSLLHQLRQRFATPVARQLSGVRRRLVARGRRLVGAQHHPELPAVLLRGQLLMDITPAISTSTGGSGSDSQRQQLELAAEVVRWVATRQRSRTGSAEMEAPDDEEQAGPVDDVEGLEDEDLAELHQLGLAARLRRSMAQAGAAAKRRAALLPWRRGVLGVLPPPDLVVPVLEHRQLLSKRYGEGLEPEVLAAVRRLAAACHTCGGMPLLLAVASHRPLSAPLRQQVAYSCGLGDGSSGSSRRGSVIPLLWQPGRGYGSDQHVMTPPASPAGEALQLGALHAALCSYGTAQWQQASYGLGVAMHCRL